MVIHEGVLTMTRKKKKQKTPGHVTQKNVEISRGELNKMVGYLNSCPEARFNTDFLPKIQFRWKLRLAVIPLPAIRSQQIFAHATTAQHSCRAMYKSL